MQFTVAVSAFAALASALVMRQAPLPSDVDINYEPSYGCPGSDPIASVDASYIDGSCRDIGIFNSTQTVLSAPVSTLQTLTLFTDKNCTTVAATLSNVASEGTVLADGSCVSAPQGESFVTMKYLSSPVQPQ